MSMKAVGWLSSKLGLNISGRADDGVDNARREQELNSVDDNSFFRQSENERSCSVEVQNNNQISSAYDTNKVNPSSDSVEDKLGQYWNQVHSVVNNYVSNLTNSKNSCRTTFGDLFSGLGEQKDERTSNTQFDYSNVNSNQSKLSNPLLQREMEEAHLGINTEVDEQGLPVNKNWYFFDTALNRWNVSPDAPESVRRDYEKQLWEEEQERLGLRVVEPPPPPPPPAAKMQTTSLVPSSANQISSHTFGGAVDDNGSAVNKLNSSANTYYPMSDSIPSTTPSLPQMPQRGLFTSGGAAAAGHTHRRSAPQYAVPDYFASTPSSTGASNHTTNVNTEANGNYGSNKTLIANTNIPTMHGHVNNHSANIPASDTNITSSRNLPPQCHNFAGSSSFSPERSQIQTLPLPPPPPPPPPATTVSENNLLSSYSVQQRFPSPPISINESNRIISNPAQRSNEANDNTVCSTTTDPSAMPRLPMRVNENTLVGTNNREASTSNTQLQIAREERFTNLSKEANYVDTVAENNCLVDKTSDEPTPVPISSQVNTTYVRNTDGNVNLQSYLGNNNNDAIRHKSEELLVNVQNRSTEPGKGITIFKQSTQTMLGDTNLIPNSKSLTSHQDESNADFWNESAKSQQREQNETYFKESEQQGLISEKNLSQEQRHLYEKEQFCNVQNKQLPLSHTEIQMMTAQNAYSQNYAAPLTTAVNSENEFDVNTIITNSDVNPFVDSEMESTSCNTANNKTEAMNNTTPFDVMSSELLHTSQSPELIQQQQQQQFTTLSQPQSKPTASLISNVDTTKNSSLTDNSRIRSSLPPPPSFKPFHIN